jgi:hypothetical protein
MEKDMKLRKFIATTIREYLNEQNKLGVFFTKKQQQNAKNLFKEIFDVYLRKVSQKTYPMIYHNTNIEHYENIKKYGLINKLNYFLEYDNDINAYGGDDNPGIACGVNYKDVIDRLYPDPEWLLSIIKKIGNPSSFSERNIDDSYVLCLVVEDILNLDLNKNLTITDVSKEKMDFMINDNIFAWLYVKGEVSPNLITITIHPDFIE